jgi:uncharacterized iron-regulated protein
MSRTWSVAVLGLAWVASVPPSAAALVRAAGGPVPACEVGAWLDPATGARVGHAAVLAAAASRGVVLLGETHDEAEHHRWQLSVVAALLSGGRDLVLGFEAFPRRVQPVLDRWVAGGLGEVAFLEEVGWREVWGFDPGLYLPLFHLARLHRVPMVALNVERGFVAQVDREGWKAIPTAERHGLGNPAPATEAYLDELAASYGQHERAEEGSEARMLRDRPEFQRFVDAQLAWDRGMAEALAAARAWEGSPLVVGIVGSGHLRHRHGVPHQLADLGIADAAVLLPVDLPHGCGELAPGLADAVFALMPPSAAPARDPAPGPRLGVMLEDGARVAGVAPASVAEAAGLRVGDVVVRAAGVAVGTGADLVGIVRRQAPGTWLPLVLEREGLTVEAVAKFPPEAGGRP